MRYFIIFITITATFTAFSQINRINPHSHDLPNQWEEANRMSRLLTNDTTYDVNFYHIDVEIHLDSSYIQGKVTYSFTSLIDGLSSLQLDLDSAFTIDSLSPSVSSYNFANNILSVSLINSFDIGETISISVYYQGAPVLAGGYKGLRYETHDNNELIIASLSTPYLAHTWWPCKDGTEDKADSTFVDITIKDTIVGSIPVIALSNGLLDTVETHGNKKVFRWKHYYPIVPYYVMVAISNYEHFQQIFEGDDYSFPIDYYVFESHLNSAQQGVALLPEAIEFFTSIFGPYPFLDEKYGMTQLGYYGAIENQTNTITNNMSYDWLYVSVHELAHMWFADMITCQTWNHGWLNEGFASYAEALFAEYKFNSYQEYMSEFEFYQGGTVFMEDVSNPFTVFQPIIYNKGAYVLHMLRGVLGDSLFFDAIYNYATNDSFIYKHSITEDFQTICEETSGVELDYFFEQWIYDERYPRYSYNFLYDEPTGTLEFEIDQIQEILGWREVFTMPMEVKITFWDGTDTIVKILNDSMYQVFSFTFNKTVTNIELDPNNWILKNVQYDPNIIVGINKPGKPEFEVYPNPNNGSFKLVVPNNNDKIKVSIIDLKGISHFNIELNQESNNTDEIQITDLKTGVYFIKLITSNSSSTKKIIVSNKDLIVR